MVRPASDTKEGKRATKKWRKTMIKKYGREGYRKELAEYGRKGGMASSTGGFASDKVGKDGLTGKQRASVVGSIGGKIGGKYNYSRDEYGRAIRKDGKLWGSPRE